jgi:hypothetical protein
LARSGQESGVREIRSRRLLWRGLETGSWPPYTGTKLETAETAKGSLPVPRQSSTLLGPDNQGAAGYALCIDAVDVGWDAIHVRIRLLRRAPESAIRGIVEWLLQPPAESFVYAALDFSDPPNGIGFSFDEATGGALASAIE